MTGDIRTPTRPGAATTSQTAAAILDAERAIEDVFLTPRVLDHQTFDSYAKRLEGLIRDAAGAGKALRDAHAQTAGTIADTGRAGAELKQRLELGAKLLSAIDRRAEEARAALERVEAKSAEIDAAETRLDELVAERLANIETRVGEAIEGALGEATHAEEKLKAAERSARTTAANAAVLIAQLEDKIRALTTEADAASAKAEAVGNGLEAKLDGITGAIDERLSKAERLAERVLEALGASGDEDPVQLEDIARETAAQAERAERISGVLAGLKDEADTARTRLTSELNDSLSRLREVESRRMEMLEPLTDTYEEIASSVPLLVDSLRAAGEQVAELTAAQAELRKGIAESAELAEGSRQEVQSRTDQLGAIMRGAELQLEDRVRTSERRLAELIVRAEQAARQLDSRVRTASGVEPKPAAPRPATLDERDFTGTDSVARVVKPDEKTPDREGPGSDSSR